MKAADVVRTPFGLLKATIAEWKEDRAPRLAAALAYHAIFAVSPLLVIAVSVAGSVLGPSSVREQIAQQVLGYTGSQQVADFVDTLLVQTARPAASRIATVLSIVVLLIGASSLFNELKSSLNDIWDVPPRTSKAFLWMLAGRALSLAMVVATGLVMILTFALTAVLSRFTSLVDTDWPGAALMAQAGAIVVFFLLTLVGFAMIYRFLPDVRIQWRDVWSGAAVTALLFSLGRLLLSLYFGFSTAGAAYGAAGALVVTLLWVYYSAQIFFFGAEFTQVFARTRGSRWHEQEKLDAVVEEPA